MNFRRATLKDAPLLGRLNVQLIEDEGHGSPLTVVQLTDRMRDGLATVYTAVIFEESVVSSPTRFTRRKWTRFTCASSLSSANAAARE